VPATLYTSRLPLCASPPPPLAVYFLSLVNRIVPEAVINNQPALAFMAIAPDDMISSRVRIPAGEDNLACLL
jgi:hypothetical protein